MAEMAEAKNGRDGRSKEDGRDRESWQRMAETENGRGPRDREWQRLRDREWQRPEKQRMAEAEREMAETENGKVRKIISGPKIVADGRMAEWQRK